MEIVFGIIEIVVIIWLLVQVDRVEISLRSIAKNLEILTQNQRSFFISKMSENEDKFIEANKIEKEKKNNYKIN